MDKNELIRCILDGDASPEDREKHLSLVGSDPSYKTEYENLKQTKNELSHLSHLSSVPLDPIIKGRILDSVVHQNCPPKPASQALPREPRKWMLRALYGGGLAIACGLGLMMGFVLATTNNESPNTNNRSHTQSPKRAPQVAAIHPTPRKGPAACHCLEKTQVRFAFHAPKASVVSVVGDFNGWNKKSTPMTDTDGDGVWTLTLTLENGTHQYGFLVDNKQWVPDPKAESRIQDGFGGVNSVIQL